MIERISTQRIADHSGLCMPKMIIQLLYHNRNWIIKWQKAKVDAKRSNDPLVVASLQLILYESTTYVSWEGVQSFV